MMTVSSLRQLCDLGVSVVKLVCEEFHRRDAEIAEVTQRNMLALKTKLTSSAAF